MMQNMMHYEWTELSSPCIFPKIQLGASSQLPVKPRELKQDKIPSWKCLLPAQNTACYIKWNLNFLQ